MKKNKYKKIKICLLTTLLVATCSTGITYSYFNSKVALNKLGSGSGTSDLNIKNGKINLKFNDENTGWKVNNATEEVTLTKNPSSTTIAKYGPVYLSSEDTNLTTNVDLLLQYGIVKEGGRTEDVEVVDNNETIEDAEGFEVIVGDIDNFNYKYNAGKYYAGNRIFNKEDVYNGTVSNRSDIFGPPTGSKNKDDYNDYGLKVYPGSYDAVGTDRRMAPTGFYNFMSEIIGNMTDHDNIKSKLSDNFYLWGYWDEKGIPKIGDYSTVIGDHWGVKRAKESIDTSYLLSVLKTEKQINGITFPKGYSIWYDGYTDRALRGIEGAGGNSPTNISGKEQDGKDWAFLQKAEPITFKYDIPENKNISSVIFQVYLDDLQSGYSTDESKSNNFSVDSSSKFKVKLISGTSEIEIPEFSAVINTLVQDGPAGNMVTLNLPQSYFKYVKQAAGRTGNGLKLLIDDDRLGTSGDSYCIDFAKMTVNSPVKPVGAGVTAKGYVKDENGNPLSDVRVVSGNGIETKTNANGFFQISGCTAGYVSLTCYKDGYEVCSYTYSQNSKAGETVEISSNDAIILKKIKSSVLEALEKMVVNFEIKKFDSKGKLVDTINCSSKNLNSTGDYKLKESGITIKKADQSLAMEPGFYYEINYKLDLRSANDIGDLSGFDLKFNSSLIAKATQENNPGWNQEGTGEEYKDSISNNDKPGGGEDSPDKKITIKVTSITDSITKNKLENVSVTLNNQEKGKTDSNGSLSFSADKKNEVATLKFSLNGYKEVTRQISLNSDYTISLEMEELKTYVFFENPDNNYMSGEKTIKMDGAIVNPITLSSNSNKWISAKTENTSLPNNSTIVVSNANGTSGDLFYFNTRRIFICTN